jgi:NAD(P)-dependent dehydrogenase (short-subunit alcohol dehydrogenase family)
MADLPKASAARVIRAVEPLQQGGDMEEVEGKVAVITGAAAGIGRGMAEAFAAAGMKLVLSDVEEPALSETTRALRADGANVHSVIIDVSKPDQVQALADESVKRFGAVDVLCNNAGIGIPTPSSWETTLDDWKWTIEVNLMGVVHGVRSFVPIMLEQGSESHIVNTASMAGLIAGGDIASYAVTKFGVVALSEHLYLELERAGAKTKVSVLCPGFVATGIMDAERNRPADRPDASPVPTDPRSEVFFDWFRGQLEKGLRPRDVGDQVLSAIREERFYILTHPDWNYMIEHRVQTILEGRNPSAVPPPGFESLLERWAQLSD